MESGNDGLDLKDVEDILDGKIPDGFKVKTLNHFHVQWYVKKNPNMMHLAGSFKFEGDFGRQSCCETNNPACGVCGK